MKTRTHSEKENKQVSSPSILHLQKSAMLNQFSRISKDVCERMISPFLLCEEEVSLMHASNQALYHSFYKTSRIKKLLHHVAYGEYKNAKAMIERNPLLLFEKGWTTIQHNGLTFKNKTALQIAWYVKDTEMIELFQSHMNFKDIKIQQQAQFPEGYETYKKIEKEKIREGHSILQETFQAILGAEVNQDLEDNIIPGEKAKAAIDRLINYLKPKDTIGTGQNIADELLLRAFRLYNAYYDRFSIPAQSCDSPKNRLVWCQIVGNIQRYALSIVDLQTLSNGLHNTKLQARSLAFKIWERCKIMKHYQWVTHSCLFNAALMMDAELGTHYAIYVGPFGRSYGTGGAWRASHGDAYYFSPYVNQKSESLKSLYIAFDDLPENEKSFVSRSAQTHFLQKFA